VISLSLIAIIAVIVLAVIAGAVVFRGGGD